jgi:hypothetical protein
MTSPTPLVASVDPGSIQVSSPGEYQVADLTLTIVNQTSSPYDLSGGLNIVIPLDPGGSETQSQLALVLSSATGTAGGQAQPTAMVDVSPGVLAGTNWAITEDSPNSCEYSALPNDSGILDAGASLQFTFSHVVADVVPGSANITISVLPATSTGTALSLTASITKLTGFRATLDVDPSLLIMPLNTANLTWQVLGAGTWDFTWTPPSTVVNYNNGSYSNGTLPDPPAQFGPGDPVPVATVYQDTTFTLTAQAPDGAETTETQGVTLATPRFAALTMPPVVNGTAPAGDGPAGTPMVTGVEQNGAGDPDGGQPVTITGTGLTGATSVAFGHASIAESEFTVDPTGSTITTNAPPVATSDVDNSTPGTVVDVTVTVGAGTSPVTSAVTSADKYTYANYATSASVAPYQPFELIWSCFNNTFPTLSWSAPSGAVSVTESGPGYILDIPNPGKLATSGTATATIAAPTTFDLGVAAGPVPQSLDVHLLPPTITAFSASGVAVDTGVQSVTLTWTAQNATGFTLTSDGNSVPLPYDQSSYPVTNLPVDAPTHYVLLANGFDPADNAVWVKSSPVTVTPVAVTLTSFTPSATTITPGESVTLTWDAYAATGYTLSPLGYYGPATTHVTVTPSYSTTYTLTAEGYSPTGQPPSLTAKVDVYIKSPKEDSGVLEKHSSNLEKNPADYPKIVTGPGTVPGLSDLADPDPAPPGGTEQAFIGPDERPDAGAPGAQVPHPPAGEA